MTDITKMAVCRRPKVDVDVDQLVLLLQLIFTWDRILALLVVSVSTLNEEQNKMAWKRCTQHFQMQTWWIQSVSI